MKILLTACLLLPLFFPCASAQTSLSLQDCYRLAESNSAISQNPPLLETITSLRLQNADAARLPALQWNAKATWQNEVFGLPFDPPGVDISIPRYNLLTNLEASYLLYDGGLTDAKKTVEQAKLAAERQSVTVELNKLKDQVNQYFFGALLLQERAHLLEVTQKDLEAKMQQLEAGVRHGTVLESDLKKVQVERLKVRSAIAAAQSDRRAMLSVLASLTGQPLHDSVSLTTPQFEALIAPPASHRPELALFDLQKQQVHAAAALVDATWRPRAGTFVQTGVGYPDPLNFFDEKLSPYVIGGVQFSWKIIDWKQAAREREQLAVQSHLIENQKKTFEQTLEHQEKKFLENIENLHRQIALDEEIATLQGEILRQLSSQLEHGVATATDYLLQSNAELSARLSAQTRQVQLAQVQAAYWTWKGWW